MRLRVRAGDRKAEAMARLAPAIRRDINVSSKGGCRGRCGWRKRARPTALLYEPSIGYAGVSRTICRQAVRIGDICVAIGIECDGVVFEQVSITATLSWIVRATTAIKADVLVVYAF